MQFKYTNIQRTGQNDIYGIRITYKDGYRRTFNVKTNKGSVPISENDKKGKKALVKLLKDEGLINKDSPNVEISLGTIMIQDGELKIREELEKKQQEPSVSDNTIKGFAYISIESEGNRDIYNIQIRYANNEKRQFRVKTNKGSVKISKNDTQGKKTLVELLRRQGLISIDIPNTEIDLGTLIKQDGNLNIKSLSPASKSDLKKLDNNGGKNYVCSDIHGMYELYMKAKSLLKKDDTLWVLGDATDRGMDGIKIIQDMMQSSEKKGLGPQIVYMFGNHDLMLLECIDAFKKTGMTDKEIVEYFITYNSCENYLYAIEIKKSNRSQENVEWADKIIAKYGSKIEEIKARKNELQRKIGIYYKDIDRICFENGAWSTIAYYFDLPKIEQDKIYNFLENSPIMVTRQFGNKKVALVHSAPPNIEPQINRTIMYKAIKDSKMSDAEKKSEVYSMVWDRRLDTISKTIPVQERYKRMKNAGYTIIHGHTPTLSGEVELYPDGDICIDCSTYGRKALSVYCIEDNKVFSVSQNEIKEKEVKVRGKVDVERY